MVNMQIMRDLMSVQMSKVALNTVQQISLLILNKVSFCVGKSYKDSNFPLARFEILDKTIKIHKGSFNCFNIRDVLL